MDFMNFKDFDVVLKSIIFFHKSYDVNLLDLSLVFLKERFSIF